MGRFNAEWVKPNTACKIVGGPSVKWDQAKYFRLSDEGHQGLNGIRPNSPCSWIKSIVEWDQAQHNMLKVLKITYRMIGIKPKTSW